MCFSTFLQVSHHCQVSDVSTIKPESHQPGLMALRVNGVAVPRVSIFTLQWTVESLSHAGFSDTWPHEDSVLQLFPVKASHRWCQLQLRQVDQGRSQTAASSIWEEGVSLIQCYPRGEEDKSYLGKYPVPCSVLEHEDAYSLQVVVEQELSRPWDLGREISFSGFLSQEGPEATCNSSLSPFFIL